MRRAKQIIYGVFYIIVLSATGFGFYRLFLKPAPSCFDGVQNQGEAGVDCGGPCTASCVPVDIRPLQTIGRILTFNPAQSSLSLLAQVSNPNLTHGAKNFGYTFTLYDSAQKPVQTIRGESFIYAGEVKYIFLPNASAPQGNFSYVDFKMDNPYWISKDQFSGPPDFRVSGVSTVVSGNSLIVGGQVLNNDTVAFPELYVVAIFKGNAGQVAGASATLLNNFAANETRSFSVLYPNLPNVDLSGTKVFVYAKRP